MKPTRMIILVLMILIGNQLHAQNIYESLGGTKTDFIFMSDTIDLKVTKQFIIKNAGIWSHSAFSTGAGYESYHLEFSTEENLFAKYVRWQNPRYQLSFYDKENKLITMMEFYNKIVLDHYQITVIEYSDMSFFSVDLIGIPISVLEATRKIDIVKYERE